MSKTSETQSLCTALYVDDYRINTLYEFSRSSSLVWRQATAFKMFAKQSGGQLHLHALINRHDSNSLKAYSQADYNLHVMNGDRPVEISRVIKQALDQPLPDHLVVVSDDSAFVPLCREASLRGAQVSIFTPKNHRVASLAQSGFITSPIASLLAKHRPAQKAMAFVDIENLLYAQKQQWVGRYPRLNLKEIERALVDSANIVETHVFGDFVRLARYFGCDVRAQLEQRNMITYQTDNIFGKNTADMEIASAIHVAMERDPELTSIVIASGDRDFCPVVDRAHKLGKEVILLAPHGSLSKHLAKKADRLIYIAGNKRVHAKQKGRTISLAQ